MAYGLAQANVVTVLGSTALLAQSIISPVFLGEVRHIDVNESPGGNELISMYCENRGSIGTI